MYSTRLYTCFESSLYRVWRWMCSLLYSRKSRMRCTPLHSKKLRFVFYLQNSFYSVVFRGGCRGRVYRWRHTQLYSRRSRVRCTPKENAKLTCRVEWKAPHSALVEQSGVCLHSTLYSESILKDHLLKQSMWREDFRTEWSAPHLTSLTVELSVSPSSHSTSTAISKDYSVEGAL